MDVLLLLFGNFISFYYVYRGIDFFVFGLSATRARLTE